MIPLASFEKFRNPFFINIFWDCNQKKRILLIINIDVEIKEERQQYPHRDYFLSTIVCFVVVQTRRIDEVETAQC